MIAGLKPYPSTKGSGVGWLGEVPEHWAIGRLGYSASLIVPMRDKPVDLTGGIPWVRTEDFSGRYIDGSRSGQGISPETVREMNLKVFPVGTVLCSCSCTMGATAITQVPLVSNQTFIGIVPGGKLKTEYVYWLMQATKDHLTQMATGAIQQYVSKNEFSNLRIPLPPLPEQAAIVRFLNHADRRIRRYIFAKQKVISLLNEQKQTIILSAVTHGLDPNARFKSSGVEWLGGIPEHWEVMLNQRIFKEQIRPHGGQAEVQLSLSQRDGLVTTSEMQERSLQTSTFENWKVTVPGDLVVNRFKAHLGVFFASTLRGIVSFHYGVFAPRRPIVTKYFELLYHTDPYRVMFAVRSNGVTVGLQNLSNQNFYNVRSVVPPVEEQAEIVSFALGTTQRLSDAMEVLRREIAFLREYRTRLIADVVTGRLDVRDAATQLPDEVQEPEPLDGVDALAESDESEDEADLDTAAGEAEA